MRYSIIFPAELSNSDGNIIRDNGGVVHDIAGACYSVLILPTSIQTGTIKKRYRGLDLLCLRFKDGSVVAYDHDSDDLVSHKSGDLIMDSFVPLDIVSLMQD